MNMRIAFLGIAAALVVTATHAAAGGPFESDLPPVPQGPIDELVFGQLKERGIRPAGLCSDGVFLRRAYLDATGTLPSADEARAFLDDADSAKRAKLIDRLLESEAYVDYWTMKWCDVLRVKSEFPINLWPNAVQAYHRWIRTAVKEDLPYDRFARELLTASGSNFRKPQVNFYRAVQSREPHAIAQTVAQSFMGVRSSSWPRERWLGMAVFFSQIGYKPTSEWKEEIVVWDLEKAAADPSLRGAALPDGSRFRPTPGQDPRVALADWLVKPDNPWFTRAIVNRVWFWLLGRGIVHPADDFRPDNPPANPRLLAWLEKDLVASGYDVKRLVRRIMNSTTYQLSHVPSGDDPRREAQFACYPLRRLEAEVLIDALCQITGAKEQYASIIPEPYSFMPEDQRAVALADASITSPFLEKFGRSSRDTGLESDRSDRPTAAQRLHMLNSSHVRRKFETSAKLQPLLTFKYGGGTREQELRRQLDAATELYLTILSRRPTEEELQVLREYAQTGPGRSTLARDLAWALINGPEFAYRH